MILAKVWAY